MCIRDSARCMRQDQKGSNACSSERGGASAGRGLSSGQGGSHDKGGLLGEVPLGAGFQDVSGLGHAHRRRAPGANSRWPGVYHPVLRHLRLSCVISVRPEQDTGARQEASPRALMRGRASAAVRDGRGCPTPALADRQMRRACQRSVFEHFRVCLQMLRQGTGRSPELSFIPHFGYNSLFPFALALVPTDAAAFSATLQQIQNHTLLWTAFGLRSLAASSSLYMQHNTAHDAPYWRGAVWVNVNYLVLRRLRHCSRCAAAPSHRCSCVCAPGWACPV